MNDKPWGQNTLSKEMGLYVLKPEWARAWGKLRNSGLTNAEIWDMAKAVNRMAEPTPDNEKQHCYALMIKEIQRIRDNISNRNRSPHDWIEDGVYISLLREQADLQDHDNAAYSERQRKRSEGPRKRFSIINEVVKFVMQKAPPDNRTSTFFREYVRQEGNRLRMDCGTFDVTPEENERGTVVAYVFEDADVSPELGDGPMRIPAGSVRAAISKLQSQSS